MVKKLSVGLLAAALLMSGGLVGVSFGGGGGITEPAVIELTTRICEDTGPCRFYPLREANGRETGQVTLIKNPVFDADGTKVGGMNIACTAGPKGTDWMCTTVLTLKDGPYTDLGTVVWTGRYAGPVHPYVFAVTGGTGAYANVRGYVTQDEDAEPQLFTLNLTP